MLAVVARSTRRKKSAEDGDGENGSNDCNTAVSIEPKKFFFKEKKKKK